MAGEGTPEVDLRRERDLGDLISTTLALFAPHASVFFTMSLIVVAPVMLLVDGIWGRQLADGPDAEIALEPALVSGLFTGLVIPALVTALHVRVVEGLARGEAPTVGGAFAAVRDRLAPVFGAIVLYTLVVSAGLVAFIVPGIWLSVRLYFAAQAAVVEKLGPAAALRRSAALTRGSWWRTFGLLLAISLLVGLAGAIVTGLAGAAGDGVVYVVAAILVQSVAISLTALFGTLLFFDLRARSAAAPPGP